MANKSPYYLHIVFGAALMLAWRGGYAEENGKPVEIVNDVSTLIGAPTFGSEKEPVTFMEFRGMMPVCRLILTNWNYNIRFWLDFTHPHPIFYRPEYRMAMGANWMHHYCHGQLTKFRYFTAKTKHDKESNLSLWQSETAYSVNAIANNPNNYAYSHIIYAEMAEAYYAGQKYRTAISYAQKSIGKAKNYLKPYRILAESFMKNGEPDKALQVASDGLKLFPDSKVLMSIRSEASAKKSKAQPGSTPAPAVK